MTEVLPLDSLTFPLKGRQLIEASAGTGKTYTITALYLRLLLGLGDINDKALGPDQILVVTFTEAATEELRDRIRSRIVEARHAFLSEQVKDDFLLALKGQCKDLKAAVQLLEQAIRQMDEAAIFTIHGFCQRMLKRHAFESGSLFETELTQDEESLIRSAVLDFWRTTVYPLSSDLSRIVLSESWKGPDALLKELRNLLGYSGLQLQPDLSDSDLEKSFIQRKEQVSRFKAAWLADAAELTDIIAQSGVNKSSYKKNLVPNWIEKVSAYADSVLLEPDKKLREILHRFSQSVLYEKTTKGDAPEHPLFCEVEAFVLSGFPVKEILLAQAMQQVQHRLAESKRQQQVQTFDDLLSNLYQALDCDAEGQLSKAIRTQFPVALIDEFQDTDPLQYGIFSRLYADQHRSALIMIGDPKQAIYAFRGADIFTYIQARRSVEQSYTLKTNWRSTNGMVKAVNTLFEHAESPFIYDQDIPFMPVDASGRRGDGLTIEKDVLPALTVWAGDDDELLSKSDYQQRFAQATAAQIDRLLSGEALLNGKTIKGNEIAVLVRDRYEADEIRQALLGYERSSVYLSSKDSVFDTPEAHDLALVLAAIENPTDERSLRAAMATDVMQLNLQALDRYNHDEIAWEALVTEFTEYQEIWEQRGVLPMLHRVLHRRNLAAQLRSQPNGDRRLTNLLHLAELLQQASTVVEGQAGILRWINEQMSSSIMNTADEQVLRLESEQNLVTIVTVHKSKGLEYPVVFLPFVCGFRESKKTLFHDGQGLPVLDIVGTEENIEKAQQEVLAEELRLLYVALTRSAYKCYLGVAHVKSGNKKQSTLPKTALGHLLLKGDDSLSEALGKLQAQCADIQLEPPPEHGGQKDMFAFSGLSEPERLAARPFTGKVVRDWRMSSYSALSKHKSKSLPELPGLDLEVADELSRADEIQDEQSIFAFPRGAHAGTFLHTVFEEISFNAYQTETYAEQISEQLLLAGFDQKWAEVIDRLIKDVLSAKLDEKGLSLSKISDNNRLVEMEFMLSAKGINAKALSDVIRQHEPLSVAAGELDFEPLKGMLKGFIDLTFRHEGRYYVLDYKSNYLGDNPDCYDQASMSVAMLDHRYDLQYLLYTLAVHRLLKQRIRGYSYEEHFGGVYYLFLRGVQPESSTGIFNCRPDEALIHKLDHMFAGGTDEN